jgi:CBS domain-containing protein
MLVERVLPIALKRMNTIQADALLTDAAKLLCDTHRVLLVVCNPDGAMVGVIAKTDILQRSHVVRSKMKERGFVHVPIVDQESKPAGVINARDDPLGGC